MDIRQKIRENHDDVLKGRFIKRVMSEEGPEILQAQSQMMRQRKFQSPQFYNRRQLNPSEEGLEISFMVAHRFADMKTMTSSKGKRYKRKAYAIYNRIIFGHLNNIVRNLSFGFTDAVIQEMKSLEK